MMVALLAHATGMDAFCRLVGDMRTQCLVVWCVFTAVRKRPIMAPKSGWGEGSSAVSTASRGSSSLR